MLNRPSLCVLTLAFLTWATTPMQADTLPPAAAVAMPPAAAVAMPPAAADVPASAAVAAHPDVQRALAYKLPVANCERPQMSRGSNDATAVERFQRSMKRYTQCLRAYDETLYGDLLFLHGSIAHGASQAQAEQIGLRIVAVGQAIGMLKANGIQLSAEQQLKMSSLMPAAPAAPAH